MPVLEIYRKTNKYVHELLTTNPNIDDSPTPGMRRGLYVSGKVNDDGGFYTNFNSSGPPYGPDSGEPGAVLAIDQNGDCIYENEDKLLDYADQNNFTELYIYNVNSVLSLGSQTLSSDNGNNLQESITHEEHLARFIFKAKDTYGLKVYAAVISTILIS